MTIIAADFNWVGLLIFLIIAIVAGLKKGTGQEPDQMPLPPVPPTQPPRRRPPVATPPVIATPRETRRAPTVRTEMQKRYEEFLAEKERRRRELMRELAPAPPPPVVVEQPDEPVRRLVEVEREVVAMPSQEEKVVRAMTPVAAPQARYRALLRNRGEVRQAIVARELLGPPLALREDW